MHPQRCHPPSGILITMGFVMLLLGFRLVAQTAPDATADRIVARPFALDQVRLLPSPFLAAQERNRLYLHSLDADRLLHTFRLNAGLVSKARPLGGWEDPKVELRGHSLGHYLSACALTIASTGDVELKAKADRIVVELAQCQSALAARSTHPGFLSAFPESFIERVEKRQNVWAPWYTLHKILAGLLDMYTLTGNRQALEVARQFADWVGSRVDHLSEEQMQHSLDTEFGGMSEGLANLYALTRAPRHLRLAQAFDHRRILNPLGQGEDQLDGLHANTQIPKFIGAAREYEVTGDRRCRDIARFAWQRVAEHRSYVIGGHSDREHFFPVDQFARHLSPETAETCNTYNMLKLTRHLFGWEPSAPFMDFYERALYNHILASQHPADGMFVYLMSLKPGHFKSYSLPLDSFWCCVGTGMENHAKYGDTIYHHTGQTLYVNLFIPSELDWHEKGLRVTQETTFPEDDRVRLRFKAEKPIDLQLRIRHPSWADGPLKVTAPRDVRVAPCAPGGYWTLNGRFRDGDTVQFRLPMTLRQERLPGTTHIVALLYGPIVLAGQLGKAGLEQFDFHATNQTDHVRVVTPEVPALVSSRSDWLRRLHPVRGRPLTFKTRGLGRPRDVSLAPFYTVHDERYTVYWEVMDDEEWQSRRRLREAEMTRRRELEARTIDFVAIGESESERRHQLQGERTRTGDFGGRGWRDAAEGGWFAYELRAKPGQQTSLVCTFWGDDAGARSFNVSANGRLLQNVKLNRNRPGEFFDLTWPIPADWLTDSGTLTVRFQALPEQMAGGLFGVRLTKPTGTANGR